jgi:hypothetical protein
LPEKYFTRTRLTRKIKKLVFEKTRLARKIFYPNPTYPKNIGFFTGKIYFRVPMQDYELNYDLFNIFVRWHYLILMNDCD